MWIVEKMVDGVGVDIQIVNFIVVVLQQVFGQVVIDKVVDVEDQYLGVMFNCYYWFVVDYCFGYQVQCLCQLSVLYVYVVFGLVGDNFQCFVLVCDDQWSNGEYGVWFSCW